MKTNERPTSVKNNHKRSAFCDFLVKLSRFKLLLAVFCFLVAYVIRKIGFVTDHSDEGDYTNEHSGIFSSFWTRCYQLMRRQELQNTNSARETIHNAAEFIFTPFDIIIDYIQVSGYYIVQILMKTVSFLRDSCGCLFSLSYDWMSEKASYQLFVCGFSINVFIFITVVSATIAALFIICCLCNKSKNQRYLVEPLRNPNQLQTVSDAQLELCPSDWLIARLWRSLLLTTALCCTLLSIPWEFVRIYQEEVAKRVAISVQGMPADCVPSTMTAWQSLKSLLKWLVSWKHDECERYHEKLLIDPLWEVTPLMVLLSALTRCVTRPAELLSSSLGRCLSLVFSEIPSLWQPFIMATLVILLVLLGIMMCGYRISVPLCFRLEPSRPPKYQGCNGQSRGELHCGNVCVSRSRAQSLAR